MRKSYQNLVKRPQSALSRSEVNYQPPPLKPPKAPKVQQMATGGKASRRLDKLPRR